MPGQTRPDGCSLPDAGLLLGQIEEERHQIARELHDECGQILAASLFKLDAHLAGLPDASAKAASEVRDIRATLLGAVRDVRSLVYRLHPPMLAEWGLVATMRWQVQQFMTQYGIATTYDGPDGVQLPAAMEMAVFRIVQEALTNIAKYSKARTVEVQLAADRDWLTVHVVDDGVGFDPKHASESGNPTFGLIGMRERARQFHGDVIIVSIPGAGTTVRATLRRTQPNATDSGTAGGRSPYPSRGLAGSPRR